MKIFVNIALTVLSSASLILGTGCTTTDSNAEAGMVTGALFGAIIGGVIGNNVENGHNDYSNNPHYYVRHGRHYHDHWDDDNGGAEGALIGAAAGALIGGIIGAAEDDNEREAAAMRAEELRLQRELAHRRAAEDEAREAWETRQAVSHGMTISDQEVTEAEKRAKEAEERLRALKMERIEALKRQSRYDQAESRRLEAEREIERLERELLIQDTAPEDRI